MSTLSIAVNASDHIEGAASALCTVVEYGDYQCPVCGEAYPIVKLLQKSFGANLRFVFRNFPLVQMHPYAEHAAEAAEFAATFDKFWAMHDLLYLNQENLQDYALLGLAEQLQLPRRGLRQALADSSHAERVKADMHGGIRSGVNGTPTFFIDGLRHDVAFDFPSLSAAIQERLNAKRSDRNIPAIRTIRTIPADRASQR